jgi:hypothetical protein
MNTESTRKWLSDLRRNISPGKWELTKTLSWWSVRVVPPAGNSRGEAVAEPTRLEDARFIAHAPEIADKLLEALEEIEALRRQNRELIEKAAT